MESSHVDNVATLRPPEVTPQVPPHQSGYLPTLDGWRAVAVTAVIIFHASTGKSGHGLLGLQLGQLGVDIFFGVSGFLICSRLLEESRIRGHVSLREFYIRRAFRILPAGWAYLAILGLLAGIGLLAITPAEVTGCLLFVRNYYPPGASRWYTVHFWSLSVEEHFYLGFPALLVWFRPRRAVWVIAVAALAVGSVRTIGPWLIESSGGRLPPGTFFWTRTHVRLDALLWGCWVAVLADRHPTVVRGLPRWAIPVLVAVVGSSLWLPAPFTVRAIAVPWMLAATTFNPHSTLARLLELAPARWVGRLSYSLYLWQQLFFIGEDANLAPGLAPLQSWPYNLIGLTAVAIFSYYLIERPCVRAGHRLARPATPGRE